MISFFKIQKSHHYNFINKINNNFSKLSVFKFSTKSNRILFYRRKQNKHGLNNFLLQAFDKNLPVLYILYIKSSLRGLHVNVSDKHGRVLKVFTLGKLGYKKAQRYTSVSLKSLSDEIINFFIENKNNFRVNIVLKGFGGKRNKFVSLLSRSFLKKYIISITDLSSLPFNGCRPKKLRRR